MISWAMSVIYPCLAAASFVVVGMVVLFYANERRTRAVRLIGYYMFLNFLAFVILSLTTGAYPLIDFNILRGWLVAVRFAMLITLILYAHELWRRLHY